MRPGEKLNRRSWLPYLLAGLAVSSLIAASLAFWQGAGARFPRLPSGAYRGTISNIFGQPVQIYLESVSESEDLFFLVLRPDWLPQLISLNSPGAPGAGDWVRPLRLSGPGGLYTLTGQKLEWGSFSGIIVSADEKQSGTWSLQAMPLTQSEPTPEEQARVKSWLVLSSELADVEGRIAASGQMLTEQQSEIDKLGDLVTEGKSLKVKADQKYKDVQSELGALREQLSAKHAEAVRLEGSIVLSQKITPMGRLVSLARDSLEREWRWLEAMFRGAASGVAPDLDESALKAEELMTLKKSVQLEQDRIAAIAARLGEKSADKEGEENEDG